MKISTSDILHGKILIVDDQEANVLLLDQMLRDAGYDSITSTMDPNEVFPLHLLNHFDLILLDLKMPGMDGFQVMEKLKTIEAGSYLPVLAISAQPDYKLRVLKAGAKDFISKPYDIAELLLRVYNMLEVRLLNIENENRAADLIIAEKELKFQNSEKEKRASELLIANAFLENLINYASAPIIVWDPQFLITRFNHAFEALTGRSEAEVMGQSVSILFPPSLVGSSLELIDRTSVTERWEAVEIIIIHRDGSLRTVPWIREVF